MDEKNENVTVPALQHDEAAEITADATAEITEEVSTEVTEEKKQNNYPTQLLLVIRAAVGAYVLYLGYQLTTSKEELTAFMWAAAVLFFAAGAALVTISIKHFICGEYEGGKKDI